MEHFAEDDNFKVIKTIIEDDTKETNILIKGENSEILEKMIEIKMNEHFDLIYLDPLYNNKNDEGRYIKQVSHDNWIKEIKKRIELCLKLLKENGIFIISIDDKEYHRLRLLLEQWYEDNEIKTIVWKSSEPTGKKMHNVNKYKSIAKLKEYIIISKKDGVTNVNLEKIGKDKIDREYNKIIQGISDEELNRLKEILSKKNIQNGEILEAKKIIKNIRIISINKFMKNNNIEIKEYDRIKKENFKKIVRDCSVEIDDFRKKCDELKKNENSDVMLVLDKTNTPFLIKSKYNDSCKNPRIKYIFADKYINIHIGDIWTDIKTTGLSNEGGVKFKNGKKPLKLMKRLFKLHERKDIKILDIYAGSGTSGQAIMELNKKDNGKRKFVLIDSNINNICDEITLKRLENSINGENKCEKTSENLVYLEFNKE